MTKLYSPQMNRWSVCQKEKPIRNKWAIVFMFSHLMLWKDAKRCPWKLQNNFWPYTYVRKSGWGFPLNYNLMELKPQLPKFLQDQIHFCEYLRSIQLSTSLLMWKNTYYFSILALTKLNLQIYRTYMIAVCCIAMPALQAFYTNCNIATDAVISSSFLRFGIANGEP